MDPPTPPDHPHHPPHTLDCITNILPSQYNDTDKGFPQPYLYQELCTLFHYLPLLQPCALLCYVDFYMNFFTHKNRKTSMSA